MVVVISASLPCTDVLVVLGVVVVVDVVVVVVVVMIGDCSRECRHHRHE